VDGRDAEWLGEYEVLRVLARGLRCDTLLARAHGPGGFRRTVLLKRYPVPVDEREAQDLAREARALACVSSSCVVQLYGFSRILGRPLLVLEYVPGPSLADAAGASGPLPLLDEVVLYVGYALFTGLSATHRARDPDTGEVAPIVHRDLHPGKVRLSWTGDVKVTGFATAKVIVGSDSTRPGQPRGTYGYMAPEQVLGEPESVRTDVYSAALVLYELLAHRRVFDVNMPELELLRAMAYPSLPPLGSLRPRLDPALCTAIDLALAPNPDARRASARDLAEVLASCVDLRSAREACVATLARMRAEAGWGTTPRAPRATVSADLPSEPDRTERFRFDDMPAPRSVRPSTISLHTVAPSAPVARSRATRFWRRAAALSAATIAASVVALIAVRPLAVPRRTPKPAEATAVHDPSSRAVHVAPSTVQAARSGVVVDAAPPASAATERPPPVPAVSLSASPPRPLPVPTKGTLMTPKRAISHRIYVDGRVIGEGYGSFDVRCGVRVVRVGSAGHDQRIVVPCGGAVAVP
jgi:serine/threonine-protein kinase